MCHFLGFFARRLTFFAGSHITKMTIDNDLLLLHPDLLTMNTAPPPKKDKKQGKPLPDDFTPGNYDVVCAKGKAVHQHVGKLKLGECETDSWRCVYFKLYSSPVRALLVQEIVASE